MYSTIKTLSFIALAGTALAAPALDAPTRVQRRGGWGDWKQGGRPQQGNADAGSPTQPWTNWAATETVYVQEDAPAPEAPSPTETAPAAGGQFYGKPQGTYGAPAAPAPSAAAAPAPAPSSGGSASDTGDWQSIVSTWRAAMGLSALSPDGTLTGNAQKTADESSGGLKHQLNSGSMAQVLAPGDANNFEHVFVGGWLCELPNTPGLDGVCAEQSQGWDYAGQTGHAEILTSGSYSKIGCAHSSGTGVWSCDLA